MREERNGATATVVEVSSHPGRSVMAIEPKGPAKVEIGHLPIGEVISTTTTTNITPPGRFATFTMDSFGISNTRSLHNDTDYVFLSVTVGGNAPVFVQKSMGDVNSGHQGDNTRQKAAQAALSTIAKEVITHKAITAGAIAVGAILVPLVVSAVAAVAGVLAVVEVGLLIFADCDGLVAAGAIPFTGADLIRRTSAGQRIANNTDHPGIDSPDGCGSNSHYTTACAITTSPATQTVLDLRGAWA